MKTLTLRRTAPPVIGGSAPAAPEPKPPLPLPLCFLLSHVEEEAIVRLDGERIGVCEVLGLELDEPKLGAFAGALNALVFPVQLLVRQHPPDLGPLRTALSDSRPKDLPPQTEAAAKSLQGLLAELQTRDGVLDRRFYAACPEEHAEELQGLLVRAGLSVHPLRGRTLRRLLLAAALGGTPSDRDEGRPARIEINTPTSAWGKGWRGRCTSAAGRARSPPASSRG